MPNRRPAVVCTPSGPCATVVCTRVGLALVAGSALWLGACGTTVAPRGAEPVRGSVAFPGGPAAPRRGLPLPSLDVPWSPPSIVAGDLSRLQEVLGRLDAARVVTSPALGPSLGGPAPADAIASLSASTRWLPAAHATLDESLVDAELRLIRDEDSTHGLHYDAGELAIDPAWLGAMTEGADAVVVLDRAPGSAEAWRALPVATVGGCEEVLDALAVGQEHGLAEVEPFVDHLDALLLQVYRPAVAALAPDWLGELDRYDGELDEGDPEAVCGHAYLQHVRQVAACAVRDNPDCTIAPRTYLLAGVRIGVPIDPQAPTDPACAGRVGRDYAVETRQLAAEAAQAVFGAVDPQWLQLADRVGALTEVYAALESVCTPERRRFAQDDIVAARRRLAEVGAQLSAELAHDEGGHWVAGGEDFTIEGDGSVAALAEWDGGPASASEAAIASAHGIADWLQARGRCRAGTDGAPWVVLVAGSDGNVQGSYVFPEELVCGGLSPRR